MTVAALTEGRAQIQGDGVTNRVDLPFQFVDEKNLQVVHTNSAGVNTVWNYQQAPGNWYFSGGNFQSGAVHYDAAAVQPGEMLAVLLVSDFDQPYSLAGGEIDPAVIERAMDRTAINTQSVASRALIEQNGGFDLGGRRLINSADAISNEDVPTFRQVLEIASLPGAQGPKGPVGDQGAIGPTGAQGPQGLQGPQGERGPIGYQGPIGPVGIQGPEGPRGPEGPTGAQGPQGIVGPQGPQGLPGVQGVQGEAGPTGAQGPQGIAGPQGPEGPVGQSFEPSATGLTADRATWGSQPEGFSFLDTEQGILFWKLSNAIDHWSAGVNFGRGPQGIEGPIGPQGEQGPTGPQGDQGVAGAQGPQGVQGPQGIQGPAGIEPKGGWDSATAYQPRDAVHYEGSYFICVLAHTNVVPDDASSEWDIIATKGERGLQGQQGIQGAVGPQGVQGPEGIQGIQGETGAQGPTGPQGAQGQQGDPGLEYRGTWSSGVTYNSDDTVTYNGSSYISLRINVGKNPSTQTADWGLLAAKGDQGPTGPQGAGLSGNISANTEWQDNYQARFGNSADMRIFHNGSHNYIEGHTGTLHIIARNHGGHFVVGVEKSDGNYRNVVQSTGSAAAARLNYDGAQKLVTDSSGVTVTGRVHSTDVLYVGNNGGGDSWTYYYDDNSNTWRSIGWDDSINEFVFETNTGAFRGLGGVGIEQSWSNQTASRAGGTSYQNTTNRPIMVAVYSSDGNDVQAQVSTNNSSWINLAHMNNGQRMNFSFIVPPGHYYRFTGGFSDVYWAELR